MKEQFIWNTNRGRKKENYESRKEQSRFTAYKPSKYDSFSRSNPVNINLGSHEDFKKEDLKIWQTRTTKQDKSYNHEKMKIILFLIFTGVILMISYIEEMTVVETISILIIHSILFSITFFKANNSTSKVRKMNGIGDNIKEIKIFHGDSFFFDSNNRDIIFVKKKSIKQILGLSVIKVRSVPISVEGVPAAMLKILNEQKIAFTYQFIYQPEIGESTNDKESLEKIRTLNTVYSGMKGIKNSDDLNQNKNSKISGDEVHLPHDETSASSYYMDILFTFYSEQKFFLNLNQTITQISRDLNTYCNIALNLFSANFSHYKFERISDSELISSIQTIYSKNVPYLSPSQIHLDTNIKSLFDIKELGFKIITFEKFKKIIYLIFAVSLIIYLISKLNLPVYFQKLDSLLIIAGLIGLCFLIFSDVFTARELFVKENLSRFFFNPFENSRFYISSSYPGEVYIYQTDFDILFGVKLMVLGELGSYFNINFAKLLRPGTAAINKTPFSYTILNHPYDYQEFIDEHVTDLSRNVLRELTGYERDNQNEIKSSTISSWMGRRGGIWNTIHLFETFSFMRIGEPSDKAFEMLHHRLTYHIERLQEHILTGLSSHIIYQLDDKKLGINSYILQSLKSRLYFPRGSKLPCIPIQTKNFAEFIKITGEVKRGIRPQIPAEFIIPSGAFSAIDFAYLYNTEVSRSESPTGFQIEQFFNGISISGENHTLMNLWATSIVTNALSKGLNFVIFDFNGDFSSIFGIFKNTSVLRKLMFLKLGKNYSMNLFSSENPDRSQEADYLESIADCFDIAYNLSSTESIIMHKLMMHSVTSADQELDIVTVASGLDLFKNNFSRDSIEIINTILARLHYDKYINSFRIRPEEQNGLLFSDIIFGNKTVVLDLSDLNLPEKILAELIFLVKMKHFGYMYNNININTLSNQQEDGSINAKEENIKIIPKIIVMDEPTEYLARSYYSRMDPFIKFRNIAYSLRQVGYGFMLLCPNIVRILNDIKEVCTNHIGLRTQNPDDKKALFHLLHLDDFHSGETNSKFRKSSYQREFLEKQYDNFAILKRDDLDFPYPVELNLNTLRDLERPSNEEIQTLMAALGYDVKKMEKSIVESAKLTDIEKDFGKFTAVIPLIIKSLEEISELNNIENSSAIEDKRESGDSGISEISGISRTKCMKILKKYLHESLMHIFGNDKISRKIRTEIFTTALEHGYLDKTYDSGINGNANVTDMYAVTDKVASSVKEYYERTQSGATKVEEVQIDEYGDEFDADYAPEDEFDADYTPEVQDENENSINESNIEKKSEIEEEFWNPEEYLKSNPETKSSNNVNNGSNDGSSHHIPNESNQLKTNHNFLNILNQKNDSIDRIEQTLISENLMDANDDIEKEHLDFDLGKSNYKEEQPDDAIDNIYDQLVREGLFDEEFDNVKSKYKQKQKGGYRL